MNIDKEYILKALTADDFETYRETADRIRIEHKGNFVDLRAIIEYTSHCKRLCKYCGLNAGNAKLSRYRMSESKIIETAYRAQDAGYKTVVLQGGEDGYFTADVIADIVNEIASGGITVTVSAGEMSYDDYLKIYNAGAKRYLLKFETSNAGLYSYLHPDASLDNRLRCLKDIKAIGYETGGGFMIGLPRQTINDIAEDIITLKLIGADMAGIGPFIPHSDTPLGKEKAGSAELTMRSVALARILLPDSNLPATTSLGVLTGGEGESVFDYGANVVMRKVTPTEERAKYEIYPSLARATDIAAERRELEETVLRAGRIPV